MEPPALVVLSHFQARPLLRARAEPQGEVAVSPDLGRTRVSVRMTSEGVHFPWGLTIPWEVLETIAADENGCYRIEPDGSAERIQAFSELTGRLVSLYPTPGAPTMLLSGVPMHRIKGVDPWEDTRRKVRALGKGLAGRVLDTATGLGYTAIQLAAWAERVDTIELDPAVLTVARQNPWSRELFTTPTIVQHQGDAAEVVATFPEAAFRAVLHDPPAFSLAGHLYGVAFYRALWRVLRPGGRLFHYVGDPQSRSGRNITRGVMERLRQAGFRGVRPYPAAFGVVARK